MALDTHSDESVESYGWFLFGKLESSIPMRARLLIAACVFLVAILIPMVFFMNRGPDKVFRLSKEQIQPLATDRGGCLATDMIVVEGKKVGFMYREEANNEMDSGWRFFSGLESDDYMNDSEHHGVYDVNTLANYDPEIIPFLDAPVGSAFERQGKDGRIVEVHDFNASEE